MGVLTAKAILVIREYFTVEAIAVTLLLLALLVNAF
jgi:hypothetical protein